jgi:capsular polysaccharide transport system permease protein
MVIQSFRPRVPRNPLPALQRHAARAVIHPLRRWVTAWGQRPAQGLRGASLAGGEEVEVSTAAREPGSITGLGLRRRLKAPLEPVIRLPWPLIMAGLVTLASGLYFFSIGRSRFQVESSFIVRLPEAPASTGSSLLGATLAGPTMLGSLEDGRFLAVYLTSPEVMKRVFLRLNPQESWARDGRDPFAGLRSDANLDQQIAFFRRQVFVVPQDLTGVINLSTIGLAPEPAFRLNQLLLQEAEVFLNRVNQSISTTQQQFAEQEVQRARQRLDGALLAFNAFKNQYGELDPAQSAAGTTSYITALESQLVDLRVQEASLKRQFKDHSTPEVAYITDQVRELERLIQEERAQLVNPAGRDLNRLVAEGSKLETEVVLATEALKSAITAANNSRQNSQKQVKFLVRLADPVLPELQYSDWRWQGFLASLGGLVVVWGIGSFVLGIVDRR